MLGRLPVLAILLSLILTNVATASTTSSDPVVVTPGAPDANAAVVCDAFTCGAVSQIQSIAKCHGGAHGVLTCTGSFRNAEARAYAASGLALIGGGKLSVSTSISYCAGDCIREQCFNCPVGGASTTCTWIVPESSCGATFSGGDVTLVLTDVPVGGCVYFNFDVSVRAVGFVGVPLPLTIGGPGGASTWDTAFAAACNDG
jgi:hypothetical protein